MSSLEFQKLPLERVSLRLAPSQYFPVDARILNSIMDAQVQDWPTVDFIRHERTGFGRACLSLPVEYVFSILGLRFKNAATGCRLIYQANLIRLDWDSTQEGAPYPRFGKMLEMLEEFVSSLADIAPRLKFHACNLSYTNFLSLENFPTGKDVKEFVTPKYRIGALTPENILHEQNVCWKESDGADYRFHLKAVVEESEDGEGYSRNGLQFFTSAGQVYKSENRFPRVELESLNRVLNSNFKKILTKKAKEEWGLEK